jgi:hypothetical protein
MSLPVHSSPLVELFEDAGGLMAVLFLVHLLADFVFQSYKTIDAKYNKAKELSAHSAIYAIQFMPLIAFLGRKWWELVLCFIWLFATHFIIDSMFFTNRWIVNVYRPPGLRPTPRGLADWSTTSKAHIRILIVDHIQHAFALWPIVIMLMY